MRLGKRFSMIPKASHVYDEQELGPKPAVMKGKLPIESAVEDVKGPRRAAGVEA